MREYECRSCGKIIPATDAQQGQLIGEVYYPLHIGCAEPWLSESIDVYIVSWEGELGHTEACLKTILAYVEEMETDQEITIRKEKMPRAHYLRLPEL